MNFFSLLALALIILKIMGYVTASWWLVLIPVWLPVVFFAFVAGILFLIGLVASS
jgi:hypothetical protein